MATSQFCAPERWFRVWLQRRPVRLAGACALRPCALGALHLCSARILRAVWVHTLPLEQPRTKIWKCPFGHLRPPQVYQWRLDALDTQLTAVDRALLQSLPSSSGAAVFSLRCAQMPSECDLMSRWMSQDCLVSSLQKTGRVSVWKSVTCCSALELHVQASGRARACILSLLFFLPAWSVRVVGVGSASM